MGLKEALLEKKHTNKSKRGERQETEEIKEKEEENIYFFKVLHRQKEKTALGKRSLSHFFTLATTLDLEIY